MFVYVYIIIYIYIFIKKFSKTLIIIIIPKKKLYINDMEWQFMILIKKDIKK